MYEEHLACSDKNRPIIEAAIRRLNDSGNIRLKVHYYSDDEVVRSAWGRDFGFVCPDSALSLYRLEDAWEERHGLLERESLYDSRFSFAITPVVFFMNPATARELDVLRKPFGWHSLQRSETLRVRHSSFRSVDGLAVAIAEQLSLERHTDRPERTDRVSQLERLSIHVDEYGPNDAQVIARALADGEWQTDIVIAQERSILAAHKESPHVHGVIVYPHDGTLAVSVEIAYLSTWHGAGREAFSSLADQLGGCPDGDLVNSHLHRNARELTSSAPPVLTARSVGQRSQGLLWAPHAAVATLTLPARKAVRGIGSLALTTKRAADVMLLMDMSGSMEGTKLALAKEGLEAFLRLLGSPADRVSLIRFQSRADLLATLQKVPVGFPDAWFQANGQTALIDAVDLAVTQLQVAGDPSHLWAIVGLTDGQENNSNASLLAVSSRLAASKRIRFYGIAYGADADVKVLEALASTSGGMVVRGDVAGIKALYEHLSTYV